MSWTPRGAVVTREELLDSEYAPTPRQLDYWVRVGWLRPHRVRVRGRHNLTWDEFERAVAYLMIRLIRAGFVQEKAAMIGRYLTEFSDTVPDYRDFHIGEGVYIRLGDPGRIDMNESNGGNE